VVLFILVLAVFQSGVALVGGLIVHLVTNVPRWRRLRGRAIRAALFAALGGFAGGILGNGIIAAGFGRELSLAVLAVPYLAGSGWAARRGWLRGDLAPDYESDPIG